MARYIDADALIDRLKFKRDTDRSRRKYCGLECAISQIQKQLVIDTQAVVRCKDCVYAFINNHHESKPLICAKTKMCGTTDPMWFCADGKKERYIMPNLKIIPNPDTGKYAEVTIAVHNNVGFCPCVTEKTDDTKCPCKEFREQETEGACHCGRYMKVRREE